MDKSLPLINIKAKTRHHGAFLIFLALLLFISTLIFSLFYWQQYRLVLIFIFLIALVTFIVGFMKKCEPRYSIILSPQSIQYHHRNGKWQLHWQQIKRIASMNETMGVTQITLPYLGIKLEHIDLIAEQVSARLANRLIHEQKPLLAVAIMQGLYFFRAKPIKL